MFWLRIIVILLLNVIFGYLIVYSLKFMLFYPRRKLYFLGRPVPLTPGLLPRYKERYYSLCLFHLQKFLGGIEDFTESSLVTKIEGYLIDNLNSYINDFKQKSKLYSSLPFFRSKLDKLLNFLVVFISRKLVRDLVPILLEKYEVRNKLDLLAQKIDINFLYRVFNRYVYKYMLLFSIIVFALIGFLNMIFFLLVNLFL